MDDHFERVLAQPAVTKRDADARADGEEARAKRRRATAASSLSRDKIAQLVAQSDAQAEDALDAKALKAMAQSLERAIRKNAMMRSKYSDEPAKFMDSEVQLDEELAKWKAVAAQPALYTELVELEVVASLLGLFAHENLDVRLDVINLLADLTDLDEDAAALAPTTALAQHLVSHDFLPLLVRTLDDLDRDVQAHQPNAALSRGGGEKKNDDGDAQDEDPSGTGIYHALQTVENIVDVVPEAAVAMGESTRIFSVLLRLVASKREFGTNKLYASEILSIVVQADRRNRAKFLDRKDEAESRLDKLLQALAPYRKRDPSGEEEEEFVENLVNTLCSLLFEKEGQDQFRRLEGLELMLRFLKDRKQYVFTSALRALDHALMNHPRNCERLVEVGGLKTLFPMFMGKKVAKKKEQRAKEVESVTSLMASLCLLLHEDAKHDAHARFHAKFVENDMEKLDRVVDLFAKYYERVQAAVAREHAQDEDEDEDEDADDERYLRRLDAGLFVLQRVAVAAAHLSQFSRKVRAYVMVKFHERSIDTDAVVAVLREQLVTLVAEADGDASKDGKHHEQIRRVEQLLHAFDDDENNAAADEEEAPEEESVAKAEETAQSSTEA